MIDIDEVRSELSLRFNNLELALKNSTHETINGAVFKKEALKHLMNIDTNSEEYSNASDNYDVAYSTISFESHPKINEHYEETLLNREMKYLSLQIENSSDYEETKQVFSKFFDKTKTSSELTIQERNLLLTFGAWYEASLNFYKENYELFAEEQQAKSIIETKFKGCGWWQKWGKCVAGTIGGYYGGALAGCGVGGGVGAAAAGVGAIPGCAVGGVVGAIGGALTGAANFCDGCDDE